MTQMLIATSTTMHFLAMIIFLGHYLLMSLIYLPALSAMDNGGKALGEIRRSLVALMAEEKARFEKEKAELERKLAIITKLQKERIVPVHLLDELTRVIDVGTPVWVSNYAYTPAGVTIDGYSLSLEALRPLVDGLEKSAYYKGVELLFSERSELQGREVFRFSIKSGVEQPE